MDIYTKLSHLENQLTLLVDITVANKGAVDTTGMALSSTFLNMLEQVQAISRDAKTMERRQQNS